MKNLRKMLLAGLAALCIAATAGAVAGCKGEEPTVKLPDDVGGVVITVEGSSPADSLGMTGDVCLCAESGKLYRKTADGWVEAAYESCDVDGTSLTVIYQDGSVGTYALTSEDETHECAHEDLESVEPVAVYEAKCVIPGIGVKTCPVCHESFPVILPATGEHRYEKNGYTCLDCNETDYFKDGQEVTGDEENPEGYFVVKNVPQVMIEDGSIEIPGHIHGLPVIIGSNAFTYEEKQALTNVTLGEGVVKIEERGFQSCSALKEVILPETLTEIEDYAFNGTNALQSFVVPEGSQLKRIGSDKQIITASGTAVFWNAGLTSVDLRNATELEHIGMSAFYQCNKLTDIYLPETKVLWEGAFKYCGLTQIHFTNPDAIEEIGANAFTATKLKSFTIPKNVKRIDDNAFSSCSDLTTFGTDGKEGVNVFPDGIEHIGTSILKDTPIYNDPANWKKISVGETEKWEHLSIDGCLLNIRKLAGDDLSAAKLFVNSVTGQLTGSDDSVTLPQRLQVLQQEEYTLKIPEGTRLIAKNFGGELAREDGYANKSFAKVVIPHTVKYISDEAFNLVTYLGAIEIEDDAEAGKPSALISIGKACFLNVIRIDVLNIPDSVKHIGADAFGAWRNPTTTTSGSKGLFLRLAHTQKNNYNSKPTVYGRYLEPQNITVNAENWRIDREYYQKCKTELENANYHFYMGDAGEEGVSEFWYCLHTGVELFRD